MAGLIRAFVALALPDPHREALAAHLEACASLAPDYRWVAAAGTHLTLRFLGRLEPEALDRVRAELALIRARPFRLALGGRGTFGSRASPRVIWLGLVEGMDACGALALGVEAACQAAGLEPEPRGFNPHVTLARAQADGARLPDLPQPPRLEPWWVEDFVLYESRQHGPHPPDYVPLSRYPLSPSPRPALSPREEEGRGHSGQ